MLNQSNIILSTDGYKPTHWLQYPPTVTHMQSYLESRGGGPVRWFGLQMILDDLVGSLCGQWGIEDAHQVFRDLYGTPTYFNEDGWQHIADMHDGYLPIRIRAVPEGRVIPSGNVLMTVENTDPKVPWLTNYIETLLMQVWYPTTVCTISWRIREMLKELNALTGSLPSPYQLHDFGYRGVSSGESAARGACGHLVNFKGTDTLAGIAYAQEFYNAGEDAGHTIMAAEHSTITAWGKDREKDAYEHILNSAPESATIAIVSDSYDIYNACRNIYGDALRDTILKRSGTLVIRPDSGVPWIVARDVLSILWEKFGGHTNARGFKVLDPHVRVIYGDGIDETAIRRICKEAHASGFATENLAFGMGGALLQHGNRDTFEFALKACAVRHGNDADWTPISKTTSTDVSKKSKAGRLSLVRSDSGEYATVPEVSDPDLDELVTVYENGEIVTEWSWDEVVNAA